MPPPGAPAPAQTRWNHSQQDAGAGHACPDDVEGALRGAYRACDDLGLHFGHRKMVRLVRAYLANRTAEQTFGQWVIAYADPTGETAVRNVMRGGAPR